MGLLQNAYFAADPDFPNFPGIGGQRPQTISHGGFLRIVTSLTRPVSLPSRIGKENNCTLHALTAAARRNTSLREGGGLGRSPKPEGASGRTAHLTARDGTSPAVLITPITYHPPSKPELHRPLAPSGTCGASSLPEGAMGCGGQKRSCCKSLVLQQARVFIPSSQCRGLCSGAGRPQR